MTAKLRAELPYWIATGEEECPFCYGRYVYEVEVRCHESDRPMCPICVVKMRSKHEICCPQCPDEEEC